MRNRRNQTWAQLGVELGLQQCSGAPCPSGLGTRAHRAGRVDLAGIVHWEGFPRKSTTRGLRHFLKLAGLALNPYWAGLPRWLQLYHQNVWASWMAQRRFHIRIPTDEADADRRIVQRAHFTKRLRLRTTHRNVYAWLYSPTKGPAARARRAAKGS